MIVIDTQNIKNIKQNYVVYMRQVSCKIHKKLYATAFIITLDTEFKIKCV